MVFAYIRDGEDPLYTGEYPNAAYAAVFDIAYGIQHAEGTFGDWDNDREIYIYPCADFGKADITGAAYTCIIDVSIYSI